MHKGKFSVWHLALVGFAAQLPDRFDDVEHAAGCTRMAEGQQTTVGVAG